MAYLDGELPVERARECAAHLEQCVECQRMAGDLKSVDQQLSFWQVGAAPESVAGAVMAEVENWQGLPKSKEGGEFRTTRWLQLRPWVWGLAGAVSALLVVGLISIRRSTAHLDTFGRVNQPAASVDISPFTARGGDGLAISKKTPTTKMVLEAQQAQDALSPASSLAARADTNALFHGLGDHAQNSFSTNGQLAPDQQGPMIARTASLTLVAKSFDEARTELDAALRRHNGYAAQLTVDAPGGAGRSLVADLRIPASQLDVALAEIKKLGRVEQETQGGEEVTQQYVDLNARLSNARNTEQRLVEVLQQRTGKMADILAVENEIARVRGDIEQMEAERKSLERRVAYAALQVELKEEYKASLNLNVAPPSGAARLRNSLVDGLGAATDSLMAFFEFLLYCGPVLLLWMLILFWPARALWRHLRANPAAK
jgi:hypothetical protein